MKSNSPLDRMIRIGTLAGKGPKTAEYIRGLIPLGFECFQVNFWQTLDNTNLKKLAEEVRPITEKSGTIVSSLGMFGNPLGTNEIDEVTRKGWEATIDAAPDFGCDIVAGFAGRVVDKPVPESIERYKQVFGPLGERAAKKGVRIAFENCPMGGTWERGDWNIAFNPDAWQLMFDALPGAKNIGLEWEPCHQMCQLIDPIAQLREWAPRVFHVHGKDASIYRDVIAKHGVTGKVPFVEHRHPGFGDSNWTDIFSILRKAGFQGTVDIEGWHDPVYKDDLEMTGQVHALKYLQRCRGGDYVPAVAGF